MKYVLVFFIVTAMFLDSCRGNSDSADHAAITAEMAQEGVSSYCHEAYDWSVAEGDSGIMSVTMGEETDSAFHVVFRSYTGALVNFYVRKDDGKTRLVELVPALGIESEAGTINLFDYLDK